MTNWRTAAEASANPVVYPGGMAEIIEEIKSLGDQIRTHDEEREALIGRRRELVLMAREQGMTWRALAMALGMTEHGLIKATKGK